MRIALKGRNRPRDKGTRVYGALSGLTIFFCGQTQGIALGWYVPALQADTDRSSFRNR
jgi:hypothetical protein